MGGNQSRRPENNIEIIREYSGNRDIIAIVKANAYGHGDAECALAMNHIGVKHFAVSNLWEAQNLSSAGVEGDILLFGYCDIPLDFEILTRTTYLQSEAFHTPGSFPRRL